MIQRKYAALVVVLASAGLVSAQSPAPASAQPAKPADTAAPADMPSAASLIAKNIEASGGKAAIEAIKNRVITARLAIPAQNLSGTVKSVSAMPNLNRTTLEIQGLGKVEQGTDGKVAWSNSAMQGPQILEGLEREAYVRANDLQADLAIEKLYNATTKGKESVGGTEAWRVELIDKADPTRKPIQHFYDADTGRLIKRSEVMTMSMGEVSTEYRFESYKKFGGVFVPTVTRQSVMGMENIVTVETVEFPETIDPVTFALPDEVKELLNKPKDPAKDAAAKTTDKPADKPAEKPADQPAGTGKP